MKLCRAYSTMIKYHNPLVALTHYPLICRAFSTFLAENPDIDFTPYLLVKAHEWYWNDYIRTKEIKDSSPVGFKLKWLRGESEDATNNHSAFVNPISNAKDRWDKIK